MSFANTASVGTSATSSSVSVPMARSTIPSMSISFARALEIGSRKRLSSALTNRIDCRVPLMFSTSRAKERLVWTNNPEGMEMTASISPRLSSSSRMLRSPPGLNRRLWGIAITALPRV